MISLHLLNQDNQDTGCVCGDVELIASCQLSQDREDPPLCIIVGGLALPTAFLEQALDLHRLSFLEHRRHMDWCAPGMRLCCVHDPSVDLATQHQTFSICILPQ